MKYVLHIQSLFTYHIVNIKPIAKVENGKIHLKVTEDLIDVEVEVGDFGIGDTVTYQLTSKVPDMTGYNSYTFKFSDITENCR